MADTSVLVVGGSLNGLTTAALLAKHGVACTVVERHASTTVQYKFRGISPRSMCSVDPPQLCAPALSSAIHCA